MAAFVSGAASNRYTPDMRARWLHLLIAMVLATGPITLTFCQVECGAHAARTPDAPQHSCHDAATSGARITTPSHACGHSNELPDESITAVTIVHSPLAVLPLPIVSTSRLSVI